MKNSNEKNIFVFGASIVQGFWDIQGGWATRLKQYFEALMITAPNFPETSFFYSVFPLGISGDTTKDILGRFEFETKQRTTSPAIENIFIFSIGSNDTAFLTLTESKKNIKEITKRAKRLSRKIAFLEETPVNESLTKPVVWDKECFYENKKINAYNKVLEQIAKENNVDVIRLFDGWTKLNYQKMLADGVHPNDKGHKYIFEKVRDFLVKKYF
jgi:acyl-CoA thioesterase I